MNYAFYTRLNSQTPSYPIVAVFQKLLTSIHAFFAVEFRVNLDLPILFLQANSRFPSESGLKSSTK